MVLRNSSRLESVGDGVLVVSVPQADEAVCSRKLSAFRVFRNVTLPTGIFAVGPGWFAGSGVRRVVFSLGVIEIGDGAFADTAADPCAFRQ